MRQVGFKIVVDSSALKGVDLKGVVGELRKIEESFKLDGRVDKGFQRNVTNLDKMRVSLDKVNPALERYVELMREAVALNVSGGGIGGGIGGGRINGGSRVGNSNDSVRIGASAFSGFVRRGDSFTSQLGSIVSGAGRFSSIGNIGLGASVLGTAEVVRQMVEVVNITREFSGASADLAARLGTTREGVRELTDEAIRLGDSMVFTASEIVGVQVELAKLGFGKDVIKQITDDVARFSVVAGGSVEESAQLAGATLLTFEKDASQIEEVVKLLSLSTAKTAIDFQSLRQGATQLFSTAASFGLELSETLALLGALKNAGLSDSVAATASRNILLNLADDGGKLRDVLRQLGTDSVEGLDGIIGALKVLDASGINLSETFELTDKRSVNAFNTFLRGADDLNGLKESINGTNEEFRIMERERLNSLDGDIKLFKSNVDSLALSLGVEGLARSFVNMGTAGLKAFKGLISIVGDAFSFQQSLADEAISYLDILDDVNLTESERINTIATLKTIYGDYLNGVDIEKASLEEIKDLKRTINEEDLKRREAIGIQNELNQILEKEVELTEKLSFFRRLSQVGDGSRQKGIIGELSEDVIENQLKASRLVLRTNPRDITADQFSQFEGFQGRDDVLGVASRAAVRRVRNFFDEQGFGRLNPRNKQEALGVINGRKSIIDEENAKIEEFKKTLDVNSAAYRLANEQIQENNKLKDKFRLGTGVDPTDGRKKEEEVFLEGSLAFFEKELQKAEEELKRIPLTAATYEKQAAAVGNLREKVEAAKKKQEELTRTKKELAEERLKARKDEIEVEFRGDKGEVNQIDKQIELTKAEIEFALTLGDDTDKLNQTLDELIKKRAIAKDKADKIAFGERLSEKLNKVIEANKFEAETRIENGENETIVELERLIKDSVATEDALEVRRAILATEEEITAIDLQIKKERNKRRKAETELEVEGINEKFLEESKSLQGIDVAIEALNRGDFQKADQAIKIYENSVRRLELVRDRAIALARGDEAGAKKIEFDLELLDFNIAQDGVDRYRNSLLEVVDALGQVGSALIGLQRANIDRKEDDEISRIEREYAARIEAVKGNTAEEQRLKEELEKRKSEIEKRAAKERQSLAIKEAIIGVALSIIQARSIAGRIAAGVVGAIQIATIRRQKFAKGGYYTGAGSQLDETGEYSTGNAILHAGEYVVRRKTVQKYPHIIRALDQDRIRYASGGPIGFGVSGGGEARISSSDIEYLTKTLTESVSSSVYSSIMSATSKAYQESTEVLKSSRVARELNRKENYILNSY